MILGITSAAVLVALAGASAMVSSSDDDDVNLAVAAKRKREQRKQPARPDESFATAKKPPPKKTTAVTVSQKKSTAGLGDAMNPGFDPAAALGVGGASNSNSSSAGDASDGSEERVPYFANPLPEDLAEAVRRAGGYVDKIRQSVYDLLEGPFISGIDPVVGSWGGVCDRLSAHIPESVHSKISSIPNELKPSWNNEKKWKQIKHSILELELAGGLTDEDCLKLRQLPMRIVFHKMYGGEGSLNVHLLEGGRALSPSGGRWEERKAIWDIIYYAKTLWDFMLRFGDGDDASVKLVEIFETMVEEYDLPHLVQDFWDLLDLPHPTEFFGGNPFPAGLHMLLQSPISAGIIEWAPDRSGVTVRESSSAFELIKYCGKKLRSTKEIRATFIKWGFAESDQTFTHDLFQRDRPHLSMRMGACGRVKGDCEHCESNGYLMSGSVYCAACAGHDATRIPLGSHITPEDRQLALDEIKERKAACSATKKGASKEIVAIPTAPTAFEVYEEDDAWKEYYRDGGTHDQWRGNKALYSYDQLDGLSVKLCGRVRDEVTHLDEDDRDRAPTNFIAHFGSTCLKAKVRACSCCGDQFPMPASKDDCRLSYAYHWDHTEKPPPGTYMLPSRAFTQSAHDIRFQMEHGRLALVCVGCHEFGTTRGWAVDRNYVCKVAYEVPDGPAPKLVDVLASLRKFRTIFATEELRYSGLVPKISTEDVQHLTWRTTGFLLSDVVTWQWDKRSRKNQSVYLIMDLYINLTKKMQGKCCLCGADIANRPPYQLSLFHGDHGPNANAASGKKTCNPSILRTKRSFKEVDGELKILRGWCCAACHAKSSRDIGGAGHVRN